MSSIVSEAGIDPVIGWTLRIFLAAVFARALLAKLRAPREFASAVEGYALLPGGAAPLAAAGILAFELVLVVALMTPPIASLAAQASGALLLVYAIAIGINLARGRRDIDCGCAGPMRRQALHELLIARNLVYVSMAGLAAVELTPRPIGWLDVSTIGLGAVVLTVLAEAFDGLAALAPHSRRLGGSQS